MCDICVCVFVCMCPCVCEIVCVRVCVCVCVCESWFLKLIRPGIMASLGMRNK